MIRKIWAILTVFMLLSTAVVAIAQEDDYEGDANDYYDEQLEKLNTTILGDWQYMLLEDGSAALVRYLGTQEELLIPDTIGGVAVTAVYSFCFAANLELTTITLPKSVTTLYEDAFMYSPATKIVLNDGLVTIGDTAFFTCDQLTSIKIPASVTYIGTYAFENCASLTKLTIEEGVQEIAGGAFVYCDALQTLAVPKSVVRIGTEAFPARKDFVLQVADGSFAQTYAAKNNIATTVIP